MIGAPSLIVDEEKTVFGGRGVGETGSGCKAPGLGLVHRSIVMAQPINPSFSDSFDPQAPILHQRDPSRPHPVHGLRSHFVHPGRAVDHAR